MPVTTGPSSGSVLVILSYSSTITNKQECLTIFTRYEQEDLPCLERTTSDGYQCIHTGSPTCFALQTHIFVSPVSTIHWVRIWWPWT